MLTQQKFLTRCEKSHGNRYDYSKSVYEKWTKKVEIICSIHGSFWQSPAVHINQISGCPECGKTQKKKSTSFTQQEFENKAKEIHGDKYNYSKTIYVDSRTPVEIICPTHDSFWQKPNSHMYQKSGCPKCGKIKWTKSNTLTQIEWIEKARSIHGYEYDYSKSNYKRLRNKVEIICKKHGSFWQTPESHILQKSGCPKCKSSKGEQKIMGWLTKNNVGYIHQKRFGDCKSPKGWPLIFDFYLKSRNLCIEFDGAQHFGLCYMGNYLLSPEKLAIIRTNDGIKDEYCRKKGIVLLRIPYTHMSNIDSILTKNI